MGLLYPDSDQLVPYARKYWRQYRRKGGKEMAVCDDFKRTLAREVPIHFIGVWDTVSSVGMQNIILHVSDFPFCFSNPSVKTVRHAVSIDERRAFFRQNLMGHYPNQDVKNVWFAGVHSDVGGGYPPPECGLSKEAFQWMMAEAQLSGLKIKTAPLSGAYADALTQGSPPDPLGPIHHSLTWKWAAAEVIPTRHISMTDHNQYHWAMNLGRPRNVLASKDIPGVAVHESVLDRIDRLGAYRPPNLPNSSAGLRAIYRIEPRIHVK
jgi:uncharacterized protein (DUF2235 family)